MCARLFACLSVVLACAATLAPSVRADKLADVRRAGSLRWGADQEGGGPYVYPRDDDPNKVTGFELEVANRIAEYLGVRAEFTQSQWDTMPQMLRTDKLDIILNGYELTPERLDLMDATIPYYVYRLQLLGRQGDSTYTTWDSFKRTAAHRPGRIGVLTGSAAETYARGFCNDPGPAGPSHTSSHTSAASSTALCEVIDYDGNTDTMREVETGKLDGTVEDTPVATFYRPRFPRLIPIGAPVAEGYYVVYVKRGETSLRDAINSAFIAMIQSGELERIYRRYGLWDEAQNRLSAIADAGKFYGLNASSHPPETNTAAAASVQPVKVGRRARGWAVVRSDGGVLLQSAGMTILLSVLSFPLAIAIGLLVALGRLYGPNWLKLPLAGYVEFLRGTPLMLQLYFIFFFLPEVGVRVPALLTAILGLAINYSAYESEIYRAGLQAVPAGQMEAALSLGMSRGLSIRRIIVPQAVRIMIPPVVSDFIALYKDTSVCSVITIVELTKRFSILSMSTQATIELMLMTGALYLAMSYPIAVVSRHLEKRLGVGVGLL